MQTTLSVYERGIDLYRSGAVTKTPTKGMFVVGNHFVDTRSDTPCDCNYAYYNPNSTCKHVVASLRRMLDDLMYLTA